MSTGASDTSPSASGQSPEEVAAAAAEAAQKKYSGRSYWDIVKSQFFKDKLAVAAAWLVLLLFGLAIFAPFIANNKPLYIRGVFRKNYGTVYRELVFGSLGSDLQGMAKRYERERLAWEERSIEVRELYERLDQDTALELVRLIEPCERKIDDQAWDKNTFLVSEVFTALDSLTAEVPRFTEVDLDTVLVKELEDLTPPERFAKAISFAYDLPGNLLTTQRLSAFLELARERWETEVGLAQGTLREKFETLLSELDFTVHFKTNFLKSQRNEQVQAQADSLLAEARTLFASDFMTSEPERRKQLDAQAVQLGQAFKALFADKGPRPERKPVELNAIEMYPMLDDLDVTDSFFMPAWLLLVVLFPLLSWFGMKSVGKRLLICVAPAMVCALLWSTFDKVLMTTDFKDQIQNGDIELEDVVWAPVAFGINENDSLNRFTEPYAWVLIKRVLGWEDEEDAESSGEAGEAGADAESSGTDSGVAPFGFKHWLGTDNNGRDVMTRLLWGGRISLSVGFVSMGFAAFIGIIMGSLAGYYRGWVDFAIMRMIEIVMSVPALLLILTVIAFVPPSIFNIMIVIGLTRWTSIARLMRGEFIRLGDQEFVLAARALGVSNTRIIFRHILPNGMAPILVSVSFGIAAAILIESALSFLGFGIMIPFPSWGGLLSDARETVSSDGRWWIIWCPGFMIFLSIVVYNLVGEGLRDALDPRLKV